VHALKRWACRWRSALQEAARIGAARVQVDGSGDLAPPGGSSQTGRREFRNLLRSLDLELTAPGLPVAARLGLWRKTCQPRLEHARQVMQLSFDVGPRMVIIDGPRVPEGKPDAPTEPAATSRIQRRGGAWSSWHF